VRIADDKIDHSLPDKLKAESPGILAWPVNGLRKYLTLGLNESGLHKKCHGRRSAG
jgi:hypothetical protein